MRDLTVKFKVNDDELRNALSNEFGEDVDFYESKGFDGSEFVFVAVIPILELTFQITDFFMNHFAKKENTGRVIVRENKEISIEGYTAKEVRDILLTILEDDDEEN